MAILTQIIGLMGFIVAVLSFQQNSQKKIVTFQLVSSALFCCHFTLLGATIGATLNGIGIIRAAIFSNKGKKWANNKFWLLFFVVIFISVGLYSWQGIISIFPIIGMILTTFAFWIENPKYVRFVSLPSSPCWLIYNIANGSLGGALTETFVMISIAIAIYRYDIAT